jgi:glycosyltransferase involved in cell wall biosynthesis
MVRWSSAHASRYYHLLTKVAELGHEVIVVQPPNRGSGEATDIEVKLLTHPRVRVETLKMSPTFWNAKFPLERLMKKMWYTISSIPFIKRTLREERIDLLYLYNIPQFIYLFGKRPAVVFDMADDLLGMLRFELSISSSHFISRLASLCLDWMFRRSNYVICISGPLYEKIHHRKKFIIPNGANLSQYQQTAKLKQLGERIKIIFVGAFDYSMALDQIIEVAEKASDCDFILVGAGREFPRIKTMVEEKQLANVYLCGALSHPDAMAQISNADICLNLFKKTEVDRKSVV